MRIEIHHYFHLDPAADRRLKEILDAITTLDGRVVKMADDVKDTKDALTAASERLDKINADIDRLLAAIPTAGGATAEQLAEIRALAVQVRDKAIATDDRNAEPTETV